MKQDSHSSQETPKNEQPSTSVNNVETVINTNENGNEDKNL